MSFQQRYFEVRKLYQEVIRHRRIIIACFIIIACMCGILRTRVRVNYDMDDYLPSSAPSTVALERMRGTFKDSVPDARIMVRVKDRQEAAAFQKKLEETTGIEKVSWLTDDIGADIPPEMFPHSMTDQYYKNGYALFTAAIREDQRIEAIDNIRRLIGDRGWMTGSAVNNAVATKGTVTEIRKIAVIAVLLILLILFLTTRSWAAPLLIMAGLLTAVVINAGSNILFGEISFVTNAAGSILQIAVSLDYSVFLLQRFEEFRTEYSRSEDAMLEALLHSTSSILSSGLTTVIGFLALCFMRFRIGPDLGLALAKGIAISLITVFVLLPGLILETYPWMEKTRHRSFLPSFDRLGRFVLRVMLPVSFVFVLLLLPALHMDGINSYYYGNNFDPDHINLAELQRMTGISRAQLRRFQKNGFQAVSKNTRSHRDRFAILNGYTGILDNLLKAGVTNSRVGFEHVRDAGFTGSQTTVKRYMREHADLVPAKRALVVPQRSRGRRFFTEPGRCFQMDWGCLLRFR